MPSFWEKAKDILRGKAKGSKLIVLGVFMVSVGVALDISFQTSVAFVFWFLGIIAFMRGVFLYEEEARAEIEKKRKKT